MRSSIRALQPRERHPECCDCSTENTPVQVVWLRAAARVKEHVLHMGLILDCLPQPTLQLVCICLVQTGERPSNVHMRSTAGRGNVKRKNEKTERVLPEMILILSPWQPQCFRRASELLLLYKVFHVQQVCRSTAVVLYRSLTHTLPQRKLPPH